MKLTLLQLPVTIGDRAANIRTLERMLAEAMKEKPDTVLLPELWDIGFFPRPIEEYIDEGAQEARAALSRLAKKYQINIVGGSVAEKTAAGIRNTCFVYDRTGNQVAQYSKTHLFSPAREERTFLAGDKLAVFRLDDVRCGLAICYELRFPELIRRLTADGIDLLLLPAEWPMVRRDHWRLLSQARAAENQIYVAVCNGSGQFANGLPLCGSSAIIGPWGERLAEADENEAIITAEIDPAEKEKSRRTINVCADRRPELY